MAKQYMVVNGLQLETITVGVGTYEPHNSAALDSVTLESVVTALGTSIIADLAALQLWWDPSASGIDDIYQKQARGFLKLTSPLLTMRSVDTTDGSENAQLHQGSYFNILPVGASDTISALSTDNSSAANERNRIIVKSDMVSEALTLSLIHI